MTANLTSLQSMVDATRKRVHSAVDILAGSGSFDSSLTGVITRCARLGCDNKALPKGRFCSDSCRAKSWHAAHYVKVKPKPPYSGPVCWCGNPAPKFNDNGRPKCGNHALGHRSEKNAWRKVLKEMQAHLTIEEALQCVRSASLVKACQMPSVLEKRPFIATVKRMGLIPSEK